MINMSFNQDTLLYVQEQFETAFEIAIEERGRYRNLAEENIWAYAMRRKEDPIQYITLFQKVWERLNPIVHRTLEEAKRAL